MVAKQGLAKRQFRQATAKRWVCRLCPDSAPFACCNKSEMMAKHLVNNHSADLSPKARYLIAKPHEGKIWMPTPALKRLRDEAGVGRPTAGGAPPAGAGAATDAAEGHADDGRASKRTRSEHGDMRLHYSSKSRAVTPADKREMDKRLLQFVVQDNIPFRVTHSVAFRRMISMFADYNPPDRHTLASTHLKSEFESLRDWVRQTLADPKLTSYSVVLDGWVDRKNRRLLGFAALVPPPILLGVRVLEHGESAAQLQKAIKSMFDDEIFRFTDSEGVEHDLTLKISSLVTDRAQCVIRAAEDFADSLREEGRALALNRCVSHGANLLSSSIEGVPFFTWTAKKARKLVGKLRRRTKVSEFFREFNAPFKHLPVGVVTRWTSMRAVYEGLLANKDALTLLSDRSKDSGTRFHKALTPQLMGIIDNRDFWRRVPVALRVTEAVCKFIELSERDAVHLADVAAGALQLRDELKATLESTKATWDAEAAGLGEGRLLHDLDEDVINAVSECVQKRWPMLVPPAVELACALDPRLVAGSRGGDGGAALSDKYVAKITRLVEEWLPKGEAVTAEAHTRKIEGQVLVWLRRDDQSRSAVSPATAEFSETFVKEAADAGRDPVLHFWETSVFASTKLDLIVETARLLFSSRVSSAGLERVWSQFTNLLRGNRINCMAGTAERLIFVKWNTIQRMAIEAAATLDSDSASAGRSGSRGIGMMAAPAAVTPAVSAYRAASAVGESAAGPDAGAASAVRERYVSESSGTDTETDRLLAAAEARDAALATLRGDPSISLFSDSAWDTEDDADGESDGEDDLVYWARAEAFDERLEAPAGGGVAHSGSATDERQPIAAPHAAAADGEARE